MNTIHNKSAVIGFSYFAGTAGSALISSLVSGNIIIAIITSIAVTACCIVGAMVLGVLRKTPVIALTLLSFGLGSLSFTIYDYNTRQPIFALAKQTAGKTVNITGKVEEKKELAFGNAVYVVKVVKTEFYGINGSTNSTNSVSARVLLNGEGINIKAGDTIEAEAKLSEFSDTGIFPERTYNLSRGVLLKGDIVGTPAVVETGSYNVIEHIRGYNSFVRGRVSAVFPDDVGGLLCSVCFGGKSELSPDLSQSIKIAGASHFTAVSGFHMTMITHMFMLFFGVMPFRRNPRVKFVTIAVTVVTLAIFFELTKSVTRSAVMLLICYGGELFMRKGHTLNSLGLALLLILIFEPYAVFDAGLIMTFSGTFGVGVVAPAVFGRKKRNVVADGIIVSVCASLCVLPASALCFGGISLLSPITSLIILPFFMVAAGSMVMFSIVAVFGNVGNVFLLIGGFMSKIMNGLLTFLGGITSAYISLDYWFVPFWTAFAVVAIVIIRKIYKSDTKAFKSAVLSVAVLALMICVYNMNAVNSGRTYIEIYSDSVAAVVDVKCRGTNAIVATSDTRRALELIVSVPETPAPAVVALLGSTRNNEAAFRKLPAVEYIPPDSGVEGVAVYDISGMFTLDMREGETTLQIDEYRILMTRAGNDNATPANVTVASGWVRNKREFKSDYVVYVSKSIPIEYGYERNAYYEPLYLVIM